MICNVGAHQIDGESNGTVDRHILRLCVQRDFRQWVSFHRHTACAAPGLALDRQVSLTGKLVVRGLETPFQELRGRVFLLAST